MEKEKEGQKKSKNYSTPILVAVLILLIIGVTVGYLVKGHTRSYRKASIHKPGTQAVAQKGIQNAPVSTPQNRKQLQHKQSAKASEPAIAMSEKNVQSSLDPDKAAANLLKTDSKPASKLKQPAQPVSPAAQKDSGIYIKISIYSYPSALVFIDHQKVKDSRGLDVFTPVKDLRVKPGMHTIKLIARDDPSKTWWVQHIFDRDNMIYVDSRAGDW